MASPAVGSSPAFHLLAKPTGAVCNLDCSYCFFLSKGAPLSGQPVPDSRSAARDLHTPADRGARARADRAGRLAGGRADADGVEFLRRSVELVNHNLQHGQRAEYTIQTNGTRLDAEWAAFFKEHDFLVGISIDGPREIHDIFRVTKGERGSFDQYGSPVTADVRRTASRGPLTATRASTTSAHRSSCSFTTSSSR